MFLLLDVEDVGKIMVIVVAITLVVVIGGYLIFVRWGERDKEKNRLKPPKELL